MAKTIKLNVCPQCEGACKHNSANPSCYTCEDCGWTGETTKVDEKTGLKMKIDKVI